MAPHDYLKVLCRLSYYNETIHKFDFDLTTNFKYPFDPLSYIEDMASSFHLLLCSSLTLHHYQAPPRHSFKLWQTWHKLDQRTKLQWMWKGWNFSKLCWIFNSHIYCLGINAFTVTVILHAHVDFSILVIDSYIEEIATLSWSDVVHVVHSFIIVMINSPIIFKLVIVLALFCQNLYIQTEWNNSSS